MKNLTCPRCYKLGKFSNHTIINGRVFAKYFCANCRCFYVVDADEP